MSQTELERGVSEVLIDEDRLRSRVGLSLQSISGNESIPGVEVNRVRFGIDNHPYAAIVVRQAHGEDDYKPQEFRSDPLASGRCIDGKAGQPDDWKRVSRQPLPLRSWQVFHLDVASSDRHEAEDPAIVNGNVCHADVMLELILTCELPEEAVELGSARLEV